MSEVLTAPAETLESRLVAWIDAEKITGNYDTAGIASRLVAAIHPDTLERWLAGNPGLLADRCRRIKDDTDLTVGEWLMEDHLHGHGAKPRRTR